MCRLRAHFVCFEGHAENVTLPLVDKNGIFIIIQFGQSGFEEFYFIFVFFNFNVSLQFWFFIY